MTVIEKQRKDKMDIEEIKKSLPIPVNVSYDFNILTVLGDRYEFIIHLDENFKAKYIRYLNPDKTVDDRKFLSLLRNIIVNEKWVEILSEKEIEVLSVQYEKKMVPHNKYIKLVSSLEDVRQVYVSDRDIEIFLWSPSDSSIYVRFCKKKEFYICNSNIMIQNMSDKNKKVLSEFLGMNIDEIKTKNIRIVTRRPKRIPPVVIEAINRFQEADNNTKIELDFTSSERELRIRTNDEKKGDFTIHPNFLIPTKADLDVFQKVRDLVLYKEFFEFLIENNISYKIPFERTMKYDVIPFLFEFLKAQKIKPKFVNILVYDDEIRLDMKKDQTINYDKVEIIIPHNNRTIVDVSPLLDLKEYIGLYILSPNNYIIFLEREKGDISNKIIDGIDTFLNGSLDKSVILANYEGVIQPNDKKYCIIVDSIREKILVLPKTVLPYFLRTLRKQLFPFS